MGLTNVSFVVQDVARLTSDVPFELVTAFDAIHNQIDPAEVLRRIRAALVPGGTFLMLGVWASSNLEDNVAAPMSAFIYTMSTMHCMTVSLAHNGARLGTAWRTQLATQMRASISLLRSARNLAHDPGDRIGRTENPVLSRLWSMVRPCLREIGPRKKRGGVAACGSRPLTTRQ